jgi:tetratricopeptide (TPR) repeat protein
VAELCVQENLQDEATKVYLELGRERSAQGRYEEAKDAYLAVLRIDPKNSEAGQFVEGVKAGSTGAFKAVKAGPGAAAQKSSEPLDLLAEATRRIEEKQYAGAEAILNQLLTREPGNPQVCQLLARLHLQRGDIQVALGEYRFLAGAALRAQDYLLAEALIGEFLAAEPNSVPLLELYGELHEEKGDGAAAARQYAKAVELLLQHPEPGMESLHEELFEKVKALAGDGELVARLAARLAGGSEGAEAAAGEPAAAAVAPAPTAEEPAPAINGFSLAGAEPDDERGYFGKPREEAASQPRVEPVAMEESAEPVPAQMEAAEEPPQAIEEPEPAGSLAMQPAEPEPPAEAPSSVSPDYEAHFTLGVAYKNMGLFGEAQEEFAVAKQGESFYLDACLMMALCFKEERDLTRAIQGLEAVLGDPRCEGAKGQAIRYELGLLYEAEAQWDKAATTFQSIPSFHDVPQRLEHLKSRAQPEFRLAS